MYIGLTSKYIGLPSRYLCLPNLMLINKYYSWMRMTGMSAYNGRMAVFLEDLPDSGATLLAKFLADFAVFDG